MKLEVIITYDVENNKIVDEKGIYFLTVNGVKLRLSKDQYVKLMQSFEEDDSTEGVVPPVKNTKEYLKYADMINEVDELTE